MINFVFSDSLYYNIKDDSKKDLKNGVDKIFLTSNKAVLTWIKSDHIVHHF